MRRTTGSEKVQVCSTDEQPLQDVGFKDAGNAEQVVNEYFNQHFPNAVSDMVQPALASCLPTVYTRVLMSSQYSLADGDCHSSPQPARATVSLHDARAPRMLISHLVSLCQPAVQLMQAPAAVLAGVPVSGLPPGSGPGLPQRHSSCGV